MPTKGVKDRGSHRTAPAACTTLVVLHLLGSFSLLAAVYEQARSTAVKRCEAVDPAAYQSGLLFNPDGYRSYYVRSQCFQDAAVQFRDLRLCDVVKQRRALFSSSWGYSAGRCRELVAEGIASDSKALEDLKRLYAGGGVTLRGFQIQPNGNGVDFDIIPAFAGTYGHGYVLTFEIVALGASVAPTVIHSAGYYLDATSNLRIYVRQSDLRARMPHFTLSRAYAIRATVVLDVGTGGQAGYWSESFIERVFPVRERSHSVTIETRFQP